MKKHEWLKEEDLEGTTSVAKGRIEKICEYCEQIIAKGDASDTHKFYPDFYNCYTHNNNSNVELINGKSCSQLFIESLN